jgi:hypothetical protein
MSHTGLHAKDEEMVAGMTGSDLCKDFSAAEDTLALALCNSLFLLLAHRILLLVVPLGEHLHWQYRDEKQDIQDILCRLGIAMAGPMKSY